MKKILSLFAAVFLTLTVFGQNKPVSPAMPDMNKMLKMSPAELEAYKKQMVRQASQQAADMAEQYNLNVNTSILPDVEIKPPVKDIQRLSLIPSRPPTRNELVSQVQQSMQQLQKGIPAPRMEEIKKFTSTQKIETIHEAAISSLYSDNPKEAIMLMMMAAKEAPDSLLLINNLGAMLNMTGVEHKAIPLLQYCLEKLPQSSIVLNNIGQSFMGLGDLLKAADYFNQCLSIDSLNIEANHSMGMLHYFKKEYDDAMKYFNREMSIAMRRSTMAMAYKMGKKFDLRGLAQQKNKRNKRPQKDNFEEITLGKFSFPGLPTKALETKTRKAEYIKYAGSVQAEALYWLSAANTVSKQYTMSEGDKYPGIYSDLVKAMLDELGEEFSPEYLSNFSKNDGKVLSEIIRVYSHAIIKIKCDSTPAGLSLEAQEAFATKCCEERVRPLADKMLAEIADHLNPIVRVGQQRWKSYINQLVAIVQLDPSPANQMLVYNSVAGYFNFLSWGSIFFNGGEVNNLLPSCVDNYDPANIDSLIASDRAWRLDCPAWLNIEVDLGGAVVKADCSKYVIEAGSSIMGAFEHEFASGNSTLLLGVGAKTEFLGGMIKAESKAQFYLTFDKNKQFSDFGIKQSGEIGVSGTPLPIGGIKIGGNLAGIEFSDTRSLMSGHRYQSSTEVKGVMTLFK
jgi:tetratricopeptide (TPR) repeat protein